jgi:O-antigen/teichoic acid export membrane protein
VIYERVIRSVIYLLSSRAVLPILSVVSTIVVARWLDPEDYALVALAGIFTVMMTLVCELGLGAAIIQFKDVSDAELNAAFWLMLSSAGLAYVVLYAAAPFIASFFASPELTLVLRVVGLPAMFTVLRLVPESLLRKQLRLDLLSIAEVVATGAAVPLTVALAWGGAGVWALVSGSAATWLVQFSLLFAFSGWRPGWLVGSGRVGPLFRYSGAVLGSRLLWATYTASDRAVLGRLGGDVSLGFYAMASQIALVPVEQISTIVNHIAGPILAEVQGDVDAMRNCLVRSIRIVAWITLPMCVGALVVAEDAIRFVLTEKWTPAAPIVQMLCLYAGVRSLAVLFPPVLMAAYHADFLVRYNLAMVAVMPLGFWGGAWWAGGVGVAAVWAVVYPVAAIVMVRVTLRHLRMPWRALWVELQRPALATAIMAIATVGAAQAAPVLGAHGGVRLALVVLGGVVAYAAALRLLAGPELRDVALVFRALRSGTVRWPDSAHTVR